MAFDLLLNLQVKDKFEIIYYGIDLHSFLKIRKYRKRLPDCTFTSFWEEPTVTDRSDFHTILHESKNKMFSL